MNTSDSDQSHSVSNPDGAYESASHSTSSPGLTGTAQPPPEASQPHQTQSRIFALLCLSGAGLCLVLGTIGFLLPVIPGTPFVLLASFLLLKGSPRLHQRLRASRFFGRILRDWEERGGIRPRDKIRAIAIVLVGACFSFLFGPPQPTIRLIALGFIIIGLWVILRLPLARE